ncbi:hypothetical protein DL93DRAFT_831126 [Clavulina sp. PMI_390]|nr:hypothetical protein DL93DRAFT_831126 [Clavulina sp. PMI_390]
MILLAPSSKLSLHPLYHLTSTHGKMVTPVRRCGLLVRYGSVWATGGILFRAYSPYHTLHVLEANTMVLFGLTRSFTITLARNAMLPLSSSFPEHVSDSSYDTSRFSSSTT